VTGYPLFGSVDFLLPAPYRTAPPSADSVSSLLELGLYEKLFEEILRQLEGRGLLVQEGAIVDATIIESSRRPRKAVEIMPEDRKEEETVAPPVVSYSNDVDATWIKKGKKPYYGYKAHISVDAKDGYVLGGHVTPANVADTTELEKLVDELDLPEGSMIFADKGYASENNRAILTRKKLGNGIMDKAVKNKPLTSIQIVINKLISSIRYKVERSIGTLK
jgi:IS5 family transposase